MVAVETIWQLLEESGLIPAGKIPALKTKFSEDHADESEASAKTLLKWLVGRKRITLYQAKILSAGQPGPFIYSDYHVYERTSDGPLATSFRALHRPSNHSVRLYFFPGNEARDGEAWQSAMSLAAKASEIDSPYVVRMFEAEGTDEHRFLVIDDRSGKTLADKLPEKGRLPWVTACQATEQIVLGIKELHHRDLFHGNLSPSTIWIRRSGTAQLMWPIPGNASTNGAATAGYLPPGNKAPDQRSDLFSIGAIMFRMITGRLPELKVAPKTERPAQVKSLIEKCKKYDSPDNLNLLIGQLLMADVSDKIENVETVHKALEKILGGNSIAADIEKAPDTLEDYEKSLEQKRRSAEFFDELESMTAQAEKSGEPTFDFADAEKKPPRSIIDNRSERSQLTKSRKKLFWLIGAGFVLVSVIAGVLLGGFGDKTPRTANNSTNEPSADQSNNSSSGNGVSTTNASDGNLIQELISDDGTTLWESPTNGLPIDVSWLPPSPDFIVATRPKDLLETEQGELFLQSLGDNFDRQKEAWLDELGMELDQIERLTISFHGNDQRQYSLYYLIHLKEPTDVADILKSIGDPASVTDEETSKTFYQRGDLAFRLDNRTGQTEAQMIAFGHVDLIKESLVRSGSAALNPAMEKLIRRSDRDRDINVVFLPNMLSSDESLWLFSGPLAGLRRPLQLFFDERVVAVMLSMHIDDGNYLELMAQRTLDVRADELVRLLSEQFQETRDNLTSLADRIPKHPYWDPVRTRYDKMIQELYRNTRIGVENGETVANCWLPPMAMHNLVASSELVLASSGAASAPVVHIPDSPQSLDELLGKSRSLAVTSQPDLINLLNDLATEVNDDFPTMPFEFKVKVVGPELLKEGITQNQRLPDLVLEDQTLSEILTEIMFRANPDPEATGPNDEKCKLVWLIGDDPDTAGRKMIFVTTRAAATENGDELPPAFQIE